MVVTGMLGIPSWVVDARHAAAHGLLPPLGTLRSCLDVAFRWIRAEYWEKVSDEIKKKLTGNTAPASKVTKYSLAIMDEYWRRIGGESKHLPAQAANELKFLEPRDLVLLLNGSSFLAVPEHSMSKLCTQCEDVMKQASKHDLNEDLYFLPVLPKKLSSFWGHVLKRVCTADNNFLTNLSQALLECVHIDVHSTRDVVRYGGWIQFILQDFRQDNSKCVISWGDLLHSCKSNPGPLSAGVMKIITENLKNTSLYSATRLAQLLAASKLLTLSERVALCLPPQLDSVKLKGNEEFVVDLISVVERAKKRGHHTDGDVEEQKIFRPDNSGFGRVPTLSGTGMSEDKQAVLLNLPRQLDKERSNANTTTGSSQNSKQTVDDDKEMDTNQSPSSESLADSNMPDPQNCLQIQEMGTDDVCLQDLVHSRTQRIKTSLKLL
jgi:hypothetical protein